MSEQSFLRQRDVKVILKHKKTTF